MKYEIVDGIMNSTGYVVLYKDDAICYLKWLAKTTIEMYDPKTDDDDDLVEIVKDLIEMVDTIDRNDYTKVKIEECPMSVSNINVMEEKNESISSN